MPRKTVGKKKTTRKVLKKTAKKAIKKPVGGKTVPKIKPGKPIGVVTHFYSHVKVAIVKFKKPVKAGARLRFEGATTKFEDKISSMQYDHKPIKTAPKGKEVGIKVKKKVREGDAVFPVK